MPYKKTGRPNGRPRTKPREELPMPAAETAPAIEVPTAAPIVPITDTPEFQMALAKSTAEIHDKLMAEVRDIMAKTGPHAENGDALSMARMIASSIAEMADQGTNRKTVAPEILEARRAAQKNMERLLMAARELPTKDRPKYRLITKGYFKDRLVDPYHRDKRTKQIVPTDVYFMGSPSMGMRPLNKTAKAIYKAFLGSISNGESEVPFDVKPIWVTDSGVIIAGTPPQSAGVHGNVMDEVMSLDDLIDDVPAPVGDGSGEDDDLTFATPDQNDPRMAEIAVLGTIAPRAKRASIAEKFG